MTAFPRIRRTNNMSISLVKGQKIDLTKGNAGLNKVVFGLGWDTNMIRW